MAPEGWESALVRFQAFGAAPSVAGYLDLFDPDGTVQHPGMSQPLHGGAIGEFIAAALTAVPDFTMTPVRWCARDDTVFVEARNTGTVSDRRVVWPSIYRLILRAGRVLDGRAFYDRAAVLAHTDASLTTRRDEPHTAVLDNLAADNSPATHVDDPRVVAEFVQPYADAWSEPRADRFARFYRPDGTMIEPLMRRQVDRSEITEHYQTLLSDFPDLRLILQRWAYRPGVLFAEWTATITVHDQPVWIARADRLELDRTQIRQQAGYIDSLSLPTTDNARFTSNTIFTTR
jgi:hypothetical protein